jgi:hypothetical protein
MQLKEFYEQDLEHIREYLASLENGDDPLPHETDANHLLWLKARLDDGIPLDAGGVNQQLAWYIKDMKYLSTLDYYEDLPYLIADCDQQTARIDKKLADDMKAQTGAR